MPTHALLGQALGLARLVDEALGRLPVAILGDVVDPGQAVIAGHVEEIGQQVLVRLVLVEQQAELA